jgi:hypothetical protein
VTVAKDDNDGNPETTPALEWKVLRHYDGNHAHPYFSGTGNNLTFQAFEPESLFSADPTGHTKYACIIVHYAEDNKARTTPAIGRVGEPLPQGPRPGLTQPLPDALAHQRGLEEDVEVVQLLFGGGLDMRVPG